MAISNTNSNFHIQWKDGKGGYHPVASDFDGLPYYPRGKGYDHTSADLERFESHALVKLLHAHHA